ncbi:MAG: YMGG-like glycine zipper-containing protein [Rufibacter sp.]
MKKVSLILSLVLMMAVVLSSSVQAQEKKKWSPQAKGAVIGAGTGAAAGAIINKRNRAVGGVVGGVVGAAAGYGVGKIIDNKQKKRAAAEQAEFERTVAANRAYAYSSSNRSAGSVKKSSPARAASTAVAAPAMMTGYTAGQPQIMSMNNLSFLPNEDYGDYSKPYSNTEYRRKSW